MTCPRSYSDRSRSGMHVLHCPSVPLSCNSHLLVLVISPGATQNMFNPISIILQMLEPCLPIMPPSSPQLIFIAFLFSRLNIQILQLILTGHNFQVPYHFISVPLDILNKSFTGSKRTYVQHNVQLGIIFENNSHLSSIS